MFHISQYGVQCYLHEGLGQVGHNPNLPKLRLSWVMFISCQVGRLDPYPSLVESSLTLVGWVMLSPCQVKYSWTHTRLSRMRYTPTWIKLDLFWVKSSSQTHFETSQVEPSQVRFKSCSCQIEFRLSCVRLDWSKIDQDWTHIE